MSGKGDGACAKIVVMIRALAGQERVVIDARML